MPDVAAHAEVAADIFDTVGRFRRQMRRSAGRAFDSAGLPESQADLVRLIGRQPGISVSAAAAELGLAANTASTLVSKLSGDGLVLREVDPTDRRVGRLRLSTDAQRIADETRQARRAALAGILDQLSNDEIDVLTEGLAVLGKMTRILNDEQPR
ncbi:MarR family transcriptional regulator [Mycolicibacterium chitae]|uniref:Transcriptional regulator, MarR family n=1 Tax=Mycolicibacterium chitae TaxID=1792 RepID=A0A448IDA4_MYCCI|nr:MarR family transcriptional regulator [Mycolicibacterium chitae]MCV7109144.1 MarR family transcriptional regulator [Mycolicibacterium chitae]BBZ01508.1 MarR family transcriptional regulator [Mycolicibacterium chitae]VEG50344.1 Transcriptional regulator, MarR family [Mycolicibacterium chitae]